VCADFHSKPERRRRRRREKRELSASTKRERQKGEIATDHHPFDAVSKGKREKTKKKNPPSPKFVPRTEQRTSPQLSPPSLSLFFTLSNALFGGC
jgi:hypothetical protein